MVNEHLLLREFSGKPWSHGSLAREYLEKLPLANAEENFRETDTRYLLPRHNIFTFGIQNGTTERVIYYSCKLCHAFIKPHDVKHHMITKHSKQDGNSVINSTQSTSSTQSTLSSSMNKSKKSSHKSKKKVIPPPSVPPPPLFPKLDLPLPSTVSAVSSSENLFPSVSQQAELVEGNKSGHVVSEKASNTTTVAATSTVALTVTTTTVTGTTTVTAINTVATLTTTGTTSITVASAKVTTASASKLRTTSSLKVSNKRSASATPSVSKAKEKSSKSERESSKRKRSKRSRNSGDYNPDKHCGVLDSSKRPCMRALTCANHTIIERRAVGGRSKNVDKLILEYKASRVKNKPQPVLPISIAPKQSSSLKEVTSGLRLIEVIYGNEVQNTAENSDTKCKDETVIPSVIEKLISVRVPKRIKQSSTFYVPPSPEQDCKNEGVMSSVLENIVPVTRRVLKPVKQSTTFYVPSGPKLQQRKDEAVMSSILEKLAPISQRAPKRLKQSTRFYVPSSPELQQVVRTSKLPSGTLLKVSLSQPSPPLPSTKVNEVPSQTPTLYSAHPKPMTMLTAPMRRVGTSFVLQQQAQRLERQRVDLQTVINQHKQVKIIIPSKQLSILNAHLNKQSILKNNLKNSLKANPVKRPSTEKNSVNDIKHVKVIATDMNGFILNTDFSDNNEAQSTGTAQDKVVLLK